MSRAVDASRELTRRQRVRAAVASMVGSSFEWGDYLLYGTAASLVFPRLFFPTRNPLVGTLAAFSTFFIGFLARPIGALVFGHFGDRIGRKATLITTLLMMGLSTAAIGLVPPYASVGILAPIALTVLRVVQGLGVAGEWGGAVLLTMEWSENDRRGLAASLPQIGGAVGLILGNGSLLVLSGTLSNADFLAWGWRIPFLASLVMAGVGLYLRLGVLETPVFARLLEERRIERQPVRQVIVRQPAEIILSALLRVGQQSVFYIFTTFVIAYGTGTLGLPRDLMLGAVLAAAGLTVFTTIFGGHLSDRVGRRRLYQVAIVLTAAIMFPYFWLLDTRVAALVVLAVVLSPIPQDLQYGTQGALISESFTGRLRYSGASLGFQLASIAGGAAPLVATYLLGTYHTSSAIALYVIACLAISFLAVTALRDRSGVDHTVEYDATEAPRPAPAVSG
ncbi:MAG TPA: MFS transporter [Candidatus Dormibacteraeota bacterium]|nr:MFS transporter [Candidatus Dormibacteraeota bacterium]